MDKEMLCPTHREIDGGSKMSMLYPLRGILHTWVRERAIFEDRRFHTVV